MTAFYVGGGHVSIYTEIGLKKSHEILFKYVYIWPFNKSATAPESSGGILMIHECADKSQLEDFHNLSIFPVSPQNRDGPDVFSSKCSTR